jgi:iron complex transport system ATP-binding protein
MKESVVLQNLSIGYRTKGKEKVVAKGLDGVIQSGELICLLGRNGVGKSTLLRTLSAFLPPLQGNVLLQGKSLGDYTDQQLSRLIGVVLTEKLQVRNMKVEELVAMGRAPYTGFWGVLSETDRQVVDDAIRQVGVEALRGRLVQSLSDGERQKVMIAKALAQETPVILLDEPTAFLDYPSKKEMFQMLAQLCHEQGKAVLVSTHDLDIALPIADSVIEMK